MNRVDRLMGVLTVLQARKFVTAEQLAQNFEISIRTIYRDIRALNEIGVPVGYESNKGYFIMQGYFLPPVSFTSEEANALILMDTIARRFADPSTQKHYEMALNKVKATLKESQKLRLEKLTPQIKTLKIEDAKFNFAYLSEIQNSLANRAILQMEYQNYYQEKSQREVEPIGLIFYDMNWHLIAWCWKRYQYRDFKVSRILALSITNRTFRKTDHIDITQYIISLEIYLNGLPHCCQ
ncbi:MAG: YafY family protein [Acidobacteriota bacterium]